MITRLALDFYKIDYNNPNFNFSNSLFDNKGNYNLYNVLRKKKLVNNKNITSDVLFNIENDTHYREYKYLIDVCLNLDYKVTIYSANLDLKEYFDGSSRINLVIESQIGFNSLCNFASNFFFNIFFSKIIKKLNYKNNLTFKNIYGNKSKFLFFYFFYTNLINDIKPKYCFVGNDLTFHGRMLCLISKSKKIKTFSIQHGNIYNDFKSKNHVVDTFFCYSSHSKDVLKNFFSGDLFISGSFFHNAMQNIKNDLQEIFLKCIKFNNYSLIAFSGHGHSTTLENYKKQINIIEQLISFYKNDFFVIKLHPKENIEFYSNIITKKNVHFVTKNPLFKTYSIYPLLEKAKLVITGVSTVAIETMLMKKNVLCLDPFFEYQSNEIVITNMVKYVNNYVDLESAYLEDNVFNEASFSYAHEYFGIDSHFNFNEILI